MVSRMASFALMASISISFTSSVSLASIRSNYSSILSRSFLTPMTLSVADLPKEPSFFGEDCIPTLGEFTPPKFYEGKSLGALTEETSNFLIGGISDMNKSPFLMLEAGDQKGLESFLGFMKEAWDTLPLMSLLLRSLSFCRA